MARGSRIFSLVMALLIVALLIFFSSQGALGPFQGIVSAPLNLVQSVVGSTSRSVRNLFNDVAEVRRLRQRNEDLEEALAIYQAELAELREKGEDYDRLAALLDYDRFSPEDRQYVTCDVIGGDTTASRSGLVISITAVGEVMPDDVVYRSGAKDNDLLVVSGDLGGAFLGLKILEREKEVFKVNPANLASGTW